MFEKYFWLNKDCNGICPVCKPELKLEKAFDTLEQIIENYILSIDENIKIRNMSHKIINAMSLFSEEKKLLVFVKENSFINVTNQLLKDLSDYERADININSKNDNDNDNDNNNNENLDHIRTSLMDNLKKKNLDIIDNDSKYIKFLYFLFIYKKTS